MDVNDTKRYVGVGEDDVTLGLGGGEGGGEGTEWRLHDKGFIQIGSGTKVLCWAPKLDGDGVILNATCKEENNLFDFQIQKSGKYQ